MPFEIKGFDLNAINTGIDQPYNYVPDEGFRNNDEYPSRVINFYQSQAFAGSDAARLILSINNTNVSSGRFNIPESQTALENTSDSPIYYYTIADDTIGSDVTEIVLSLNVDNVSNLPWFPIGLKMRVHNTRSVSIPLKSSDNTLLATLAPGESIAIRRIADGGPAPFIIESRSASFNEYTLLNLIYKVGDLWLQRDTSNTPPGQGLPTPGGGNVIWTEITDARGAVLIGANGQGGWADVPGTAAGSTDDVIGQSADPMELANLTPHQHEYDRSGDSEPAGSGGGSAVRQIMQATTEFTPPESQTPVGIPLTNLRRFMVGIWERTA